MMGGGGGVCVEMEGIGKSPEFFFFTSSVAIKNNGWYPGAVVSGKI